MTEERIKDWLYNSLTNKDKSELERLLSDTQSNFSISGRELNVLCFKISLHGFLCALPQHLDSLKNASNALLIFHQDSDAKIIP